MNETKPKAQPVVGVALATLAIALIAGLVTYAAPCPIVSGEPVHTCTWAARTMIGAGVVLLVISVVRILETDEGERRGLSLGAAVVGLLIAAIPGGLVELCADAAMPCNTIMHPYALVLGIAIFLVGAIDLTRRLLALRKH